MCSLSRVRGLGPCVSPLVRDVPELALSSRGLWRSLVVTGDNRSARHRALGARAHRVVMPGITRTRGHWRTAESPCDLDLGAVTCAGRGLIGS